MVRALAAYLLLFWLLGLLVHLGGLVHLFAGLAVALLVTDQFMTDVESAPRASRTRVRSLSRRRLL